MWTAKYLVVAAAVGGCLMAAWCTQASLIRRAIADAAAKKALCLDGQPAIYYLYRNVSSSKWIIHLQGGTHCTSRDDCMQRANTTRGSPTGWACALPEPMATASGEAAAPVSSNSNRNPAFRYWNRVFVPYCSGDLWLGTNCTSNASTNGMANSFGVPFCGHYIIAALIDELLSTRGMNRASDVIFGGSSAGGSGVMMNIEDVATKVKAATIATKASAAFVGSYVDGSMRYYPTLAERQANSSVTPETSVSVQQLVSLSRQTYSAYVPASCSQLYSTSSAPFYGLQCADPRWGVKTIASASVLVLAARWDTLIISEAFGSDRYACAASNQTLEVDEASFVRGLGDYSYTHAVAMSQIPPVSSPANPVSVFFSNCFTHSFLGAGDSCTGVSSTSPYDSLVQFSTRAKAEQRVVTISPPPALATSIACGTGCASMQCAWGASTPVTSRGSCALVAGSGWETFRCPSGSGASAYAMADTFTNDMVLYKVVNATQRKAVCLDDTPGAYLVARNSNSNDWSIYLQGGGLCQTAQDCATRSRMLQGTSRYYACTLPLREETGRNVENLGLPINPDPSFNPDYHDWNRVYVRYCSGDTFLGRRTRAEGNPYQASTAGHYILVSIIEDLLAFHGMNTARTLMVGGISAGGIGATTHAELIRSVVNTATGGQTAVVTYSDAGWFRAYPGETDILNGIPFSNWQRSGFVTGIAQLYALVYNAYLEPRCRAARLAVSPHLFGVDCVDARYAFPYLTTPSLMLSSVWDTYDFFLKFGGARYGCAVGSGSLTPVEQTYAMDYAHASVRDAQYFRNNVTAIFMPVCYKHGSTGFGTTGVNDSVVVGPPCGRLNGLTPYQALSRFVYSVRQGVTNLRNMSEIGELSPNNTLACAAGCGARQCSWATNLNGNPWLQNNTCPQYPGASFGVYNGSIGLDMCITNVQSGIPSTPPPGSHGHRSAASSILLVMAIAFCSIFI